jgi:hypothetical protein
MTMMAIKKRTDWRARLSAAIEEARRRPMEVHAGDPSRTSLVDGSHYHCGMFVADCILAMTGGDLAAGYRGMTLREAYVTLQADGYADLPAFAAAHLEEIHPSRAVAGDVAMFPTEGTGWGAGIVNGERVTVLRLDELGTVSLDSAVRAFRVPA